jgi:hypothetical protein
MRSTTNQYFWSVTTATTNTKKSNNSSYIEESFKALISEDVITQQIFGLSLTPLRSIRKADSTSPPLTYNLWSKTTATAEATSITSSTTTTTTTITVAPTTTTTIPRATTADTEREDLKLL